MAPSSFVLELLPGDSASVISAERKIVDVRSFTYCKVTVELVPFGSDWFSIKPCVRKPKPVEIVDFNTPVSDGLDEG